MHDDLQQDYNRIVPCIYLCIICESVDSLFLVFLWLHISLVYIRRDCINSKTLKSLIYFYWRFGYTALIKILGLSIKSTLYFFYNKLDRENTKKKHNVVFMPPFEEEGLYCFANVGRSFGRSLDQMVSADYLKYHSSQSLHNSHVLWLWQVDDPYWF